MRWRSSSDRSDYADGAPIVNVLAFDTCFGAVSAAVRWRNRQGDWQTSEAYEALAVGHAERLLPLIDEVMIGAGVSFAELDRIAVTLGPGGFTGLRVGIATARALALATGVPVVGMSSLAVMAERARLLLGELPSERKLAVVVDARREANYVQVFGSESGAFLSVPRLCTAIEAAAALPAGEIVLVGSGANAVGAAAVASGRIDVKVALCDLQPHARQLANLAPVLPVLDRVIPLYLRAADAKPSSAPSLPRRIGP